MTELVQLVLRDADPPSVAAVERRLREEGVEASAWSNGPGDRYGAHRHGYTKLLMCAAGSITFFVGEAATAVNNAATVIDPGATVFPGHSTEQVEGTQR